MWTVIECAGHPRDMGLAQGAAARAAIRARCEAAGWPTRRRRWPSLAPLNVGPVRGHGPGREFFRHFAHQAERLEGVARAAGVPIDSVLAMHLRGTGGGTPGGWLARRAVLRAHDVEVDSGEKRLMLERTLAVDGEGNTPWCLRESRPAVGFRSVEVALPWMVPAVAGVNEAGLAVLSSPVLLGGEDGRDGGAPRAALPPSQLLAQECLQRFEDIGGALDWCEKRPVEGDQSFVLTDASGALATVIVSGHERRIQRGEGELFLERGEPDPSDGVTAERSPDRVVIDAVGRRLRLEAQTATIQLDLVAPAAEGSAAS